MLVKFCFLLNVFFSVSVTTSLSAQGVLDILQEGEGPTQADSQKQLWSEIFPRRGANENIFLEHLERRQYQEALFHYNSTLYHTRFGGTSSGRALRQWLLWQNGLQLYALESLLVDEKPDEIHEELKRQWKRAAPADHPVWKKINADLWTSHWQNVFDFDIEQAIFTGRTSTVSDFQRLSRHVVNFRPESEAYLWARWQKVLVDTVLQNQREAAHGLAELLRVPKEKLPVSEDLLNLTAGRLLFENGYLPAAIEHYERITPRSLNWFQSQEEIAWSYLRMGQPQNAYAVAKSLVQEDFVPLIRPQSYQMKVISELKICDYPAVAETIAEFKRVWRPRSELLLNLQETYLNESFEQQALNQLLDLLVSGEQPNSRSVTRILRVLPRQVQFDQELAFLASRVKLARNDLKRVRDLHNQSLSSGTGNVGFQSDFERLENRVRTQKGDEVAAFRARVSHLARSELREIDETLQRMVIAEAELYQQVPLAEERLQSDSVVRQNLYGKESLRPFQLRFRVNERERWFDTIGRLRVDISKGCPGRSDESI